MTDNKKEEKAIPFDEAKTVDFTQSETLVGEMLDGRFLIEKDLTDSGADAGGIGLVYLAKDMKLMGKKAVVKILRKASIENEDITRKFQHEKEALIRLDHPNIVRILDSGELSDGNPFMVMDFVEGYSLRHKLKKTNKLDFECAAHYIRSISNALSAAHAKKILHRDIKPENVMLTPHEGSFERVRLIDFGIARVEESELAPETTIERGIGTILYIAPEQLSGSLQQTPAVDIYSLGILFYEMLTGERPFKPKNIVEMFKLQQAGVKTPPGKLRPDLPSEAEKILLSALAFDPKERPQNARQFGRDLANALLGKEDLPAETVSSDVSELEETQPFTVVTDQNVQVAPTEPSIEDKEIKTKARLKEAETIQAPGGSISDKSRTPLILAGAGILILGLGAVFLGIYLWKGGDPGVSATANQTVNTTKSAEPEAPKRSLNYFLNVQKTRNGQPFGEPFESSGREIFENGYMFRLNFSADKKGYFYLFNEGRDKSGKVNFNILHPVPVDGKEKALTEGDKSVQTEWNTFGGTAGTEKIWLIWTLEKQDALEDAVKEAFDQMGRVADPAKEEALRSFLEENSKQELNTELEKDAIKKRTNLTGTGDTIVHLLELEHK